MKPVNQYRITYRVVTLCEDCGSTMYNGTMLKPFTDDVMATGQYTRATDTLYIEISTCNACADRDPAAEIKEFFRGVYGDLVDLDKWDPVTSM